MLASPLSELTFYRTYSRWDDKLGRRETWPEAVTRYLNFMRTVVGKRLSEGDYLEVQEAILNLRVMPSMRLLWSAGSAAASTHVAAYNCSYIAPSKPSDLSEIMYLLMCGAGVGFSVESKVIGQWPMVQPQSGEILPTHRVEDSREGWSNALSSAVAAWLNGRDIEFDFSGVRNPGERIKTMGGRSSGPGPLRELLGFARQKILLSQGRKLSTLDIHDIICKIGEAISQGGVRRSALISLSDLSDISLRDAKKGNFFIDYPYRMMANNSAVYEEKPDSKTWEAEWKALKVAGTGERGIFNRGSLKSQIPSRRLPFVEKEALGTNPCGEIILRSKQFCNLTEVIARPSDTEVSLIKKIRLATLIGTYQCLLTDFAFLSPEWKKHSEEERLLGVSISGLWDSPAARDPRTLSKLKECAISTNREFAKRFLIPASTAITCIKPSGTVSQLVDCASGMHPRFAKFYLRRVRISANDPLFFLLRDQGVPHELEGDGFTSVLEFPMKAPAGSLVLGDLTARRQLEHWFLVKKTYTEHNPSVTISIGEDEWSAVADWVREQWDFVGGLSFLPRTGMVYKLPPFEEISEAQYQKKVSAFPRIDFIKLMQYETEDQTLGAREFSCVGNACELDPEEGAKTTLPFSRECY